MVYIYGIYPWSYYVEGEATVKKNRDLVNRIVLLV